MLAADENLNQETAGIHTAPTLTAKVWQGRRTKKRYLERVANGQKTRKRKGPVSCNNTCPKDCRFRELLSGNTYYCNYGQIAFEEGKVNKPFRGGTVDECTVYESGARKRRTVQLPSKEGKNWF